MRFWPDLPADRAPSPYSGAQSPSIDEPAKSAATWPPQALCREPWRKTLLAQTRRQMIGPWRSPQPEKPLERPVHRSYVLPPCDGFSPGLSAARNVRIVLSQVPLDRSRVKRPLSHAAMPPHRVRTPIACPQHCNSQHCSELHTRGAQSHSAYAPSVKRWLSNIRAFSLPL